MTAKISIELSAEELEVLMNALLSAMDHRAIPSWKEWFAINDVYSVAWRQAPPEIQDKFA